MMKPEHHRAVSIFDELRPRLIRLAYRMLGSVADAEDVVQEASMRWLAVDHRTVRAEEGYLRRLVTRICLDQLKSARYRRETYVGQWLPEPVVDAADDHLDGITLPLMLALERLSPLERAAFLLHDVFGAAFDEVAETIGRDAAACRQLASRARAHLREARPRFSVPRERGLEIATAFFTASRSGNLQRLRELLAADVTASADGGGQSTATPHAIVGLESVLQLHTDLAALFAVSPSKLLRYCCINGLPGFMTIEQGNVLQTTALQLDGEKISAIYVVRNPSKLRHLRRASPST